MWNYTKKVMDHFLHPRNVGEIPDADAVGEVGNIVCGDAMKLFLKLDESGTRIADARFQTFGCASAIASASALTEMIKGKTLEEAARITNQDIADFLGELPEEKMHCSVMGMEALQAALHEMNVGPKPAESEPGAGGAYDPDGLDRTVCYCFSVTERTIRDVARANDLHEVDEVTHYCKAGGGCGGCRDDIAEILADLWKQDETQDKAAEAPTEAATGPETGTLTNLEKMMRIQSAINDEIRPALQADGGDLELVDIVGDRVLVRLKGSCAGCPSAHITLKRWVEARLRELVLPELNVEEA
ncbi:MAG: Fe-S cluster assembly protein NifU [Kiritimatiellaeota bacterium]|nr:Fe-S cluster assembly protein NifU [Kiritimatiellota bacterium]